MFSQKRRSKEGKELTIQTIRRFTVRLLHRLFQRLIAALPLESEASDDSVAHNESPFALNDVGPRAHGEAPHVTPWRSDPMVANGANPHHHLLLSDRFLFPPDRPKPRPIKLSVVANQDQLHTAVPHLRTMLLIAGVVGVKSVVHFVMRLATWRTNAQKVCRNRVLCGALRNRA